MRNSPNGWAGDSDVTSVQALTVLLVGYSSVPYGVHHLYLGTEKHNLEPPRTLFTYCTNALESRIQTAPAGGNFHVRLKNQSKGSKIKAFEEFAEWVGESDVTILYSC
jgi:hypothetical protein